MNIRTPEPGRDGKILIKSDHMQDDNVAVGGIGIGNPSTLRPIGRE